MDTPFSTSGPGGDPTVATDFPRVPGVRLDAEIGRGGFATVYRAHQMSVDRDVAVKVDERRLLDARDRRRFAREIIAAGAVSAHPHIVTLYDGGTTADDHPYLVMELYSGGSYSDRLKKQGPIDLSEVMDAGFAIADALVAAHGEGILHRDVKPGNILISRYGSAALADFGLAALPPAGEGYSVTMESLTPSYAAPEAFGGAEPTVAMDIYALGATLYAMLQGRPPRSDPSGSSPPIARLLMMLNEPLPAVEVAGADDLMQVIWRATAVDPADRYPTAAAFRDGMAALRAGKPELAGGIRPITRTPPAVNPPGDGPARRTDPSSDASRTQVPLLLTGSDPGPVRDRRGVMVALAGLVVLAVLVGTAFWVGRVAPVAGQPQRGAIPLSNTSPVTTSPVTTSPVTTSPVTTSPVTTSPVTTSPVTTSTVTTSPVTTSPVTTSPVTTSPVSTSAVTTRSSSAGPSTSSPILFNVPPPVGSCWSGLATIGSRTSATKVASCAQPHYWEAYATGVLDPTTPSPYSDDVAVDPVVRRTCTQAALTSYLGPNAHGKFDVDVLPPPDVNFLQGNRGFWCLAAVTGKGLVTGSLRDQF